MQQLAVFAGGWTLEAAQAVCAGDVLGLTSMLVKKSLIGVKQAEGRETRYRFHEIVRHYADEKFIKSREEENIRTYHLKYFLQLSAQLESELEGPEQAAWYVRAFDEVDNMRAALQWAEKTDVEAGLYLSGRLKRLWNNLDIQEGIDWLSRFLQKPESQAHPRARVNALYTYGRIMISKLHFNALLSAAEEGIALSRTLGDQPREVDGLLLLGWQSSNSTQREKLNQQAFEMAQALGDVKRQISALWQLGWSQLEKGSQEFEAWKKAITLIRPLENWRRLANILSTLGYFLVLNGEVESAQTYLDEADVLYKKLNLTSGISNLLFAYGQIALMRGDFDKARANFQEAIRLGLELGDRQNYLWGRTRLGYVTVREGNLTEARLTFHETARSFQQDKLEIGVVFTLEGMASLYVAVGKRELAAQLIGWTDATRKKIGDTRPRIEQADVDNIIAACLAKLGEVAFSDAYEEGQKMTMDEAVELAVQEE